MRLQQTFKTVWTNIRSNKMRSFLTMLGMIIGVGSVIILISIMQGYLNNLLDSFSDMGLNNIELTIKGRNGNLVLDENDIYEYARKRSDTIKGVSPNVTMMGTINRNVRKEEYAQIRGVDENFIRTLDKRLQTGHFITYSDIKLSQKVCVIGSYLNLTLFDSKAIPGDKMYLNGEELTIIGCLEEGADSTQWSGDNCLFLPYSTALRLGGGDEISSYTFYVDSTKNIPNETTVLQKYLFSIFRNVKAYKVTNLVDLMDSFNEQMVVITGVIAGISGISLVVAGVGIMNIMLVSVSERTREIGIRKSMGAKYNDIMGQFVFEAATTSSLGGLLGILFGCIVAIQVGKMMKFVVEPRLDTILISFLVSVATGILFGYLPAKRAAGLSPIDALRNE